MAGVYIKGMDKPKECRDCPFNIGVCIVKVAVFGKELLHDPGGGWCPIEAVPDHGDLIDRDLLLNNVDTDVCEYRFDYSIFGYSTKQIFAQPAVIPANKEGV